MGNSSSRASDSAQFAARAPQAERGYEARDHNASELYARGQTAELAHWNRLREVDERKRREREEQQRRVVEERARRERVEARKAAEEQARRERERARKAAEEQARRDRERQERIAAEGRNNAIQRRDEAAVGQLLRQLLSPGGAVDYARVGAPLSRRLPEVCYRHNSRQGCTNDTCRRLHICKLFLADICKHGAGCRSGHSLTTVHNQRVCSTYDLDTSDQSALIQELRHVLEEKGQFPDSWYLNNLEICFRFRSANPCDGASCNRVHICRQFVAGSCGRAVCKFSHDLRSTHNNGVFSRHKVAKMSDAGIMDLLQNKSTLAAKVRSIRSESRNKKYNAQNVSGSERGEGTGGPAPTRAAQNGAVRRQFPGAGSHVQQTGGLSEELQCPVCLEMFNRATTLGCGHTFCAGCLEDVRVQGGDNKCPMCRAHITSCTRSVTLDNIIRSVAAK